MIASRVAGGAIVLGYRWLIAEQWREMARQLTLTLVDPADRISGDVGASPLCSIFRATQNSVLRRR
jgi:hypothetical protein